MSAKNDPQHVADVLRGQPAFERAVVARMEAETAIRLRRMALRRLSSHPGAYRGHVLADAVMLEARRRKDKEKRDDDTVATPRT